MPVLTRAGYCFKPYSHQAHDVDVVLEKTIVGQRFAPYHEKSMADVLAFEGPSGQTVQVVIGRRSSAEMIWGFYCSE